MSRELANSASTAAGPALNVLVCSVTLGPRSLAKIPLATPTRAVAWVTFGKYPRRRSTWPDDLGTVVPLPLLLLPPPPQAAASTPMATATPASRRNTDTPTFKSPLSIVRGKSTEIVEILDVRNKPQDRPGRRLAAP